MSAARSHPAGRAPMRRGLRITLVFLALAALLAPMSYQFATYWSATSWEQAATAAEQRAVRYLKPMVTLIGALAEAQHLAVRGQPVPAEKVDAAAASVARADQQDGVALGTRERWTKLRADIDAAMDKQLTAGQAFDTYSRITAATLALVRKLAGGSSLATDTESATYSTAPTYSTVPSLPDTIVSAGQVADLLKLATDRPGTERDQQPDGDSGRSADAARIAVALNRAFTDRDAIQEGLRRGEGGTVDNAEAMAALDEYSAAVDALQQVAAPAVAGGNASVVDADKASLRVRVAAEKLSGELLAALGSQLASRASALEGRRTASTVATIAGLVLAAVLLWVSLPSRREDVASIDGLLDAAAADPDPADVAAEPAPELIDARDLLTREELLHVGRAVRAARGELDDDPQ